MLNDTKIKNAAVLKVTLKNSSTFNVVLSVNWTYGSLLSFIWLYACEAIWYVWDHQQFSASWNVSLYLFIDSVIQQQISKNSPVKLTLPVFYFLEVRVKTRTELGTTLITSRCATEGERNVA